MVTKKICNICLETVYKPVSLNLNCDCKYNVHKKCFMKWWKINKNCIICHKIVTNPIKSKRNTIKSLRNRKRRRNQFNNQPNTSLEQIIISRRNPNFNLTEKNRVIIRSYFYMRLFGHLTGLIICLCIFKIIYWFHFS